MKEIISSVLQDLVKISKAVGIVSKAGLDVLALFKD